MYAASGEPNMKWGAEILNGGPGSTGPSLATALCQMTWEVKGKSNNYV